MTVHAGDLWPAGCISSTQGVPATTKHVDWPAEVHQQHAQANISCTTTISTTTTITT
jgi:hypothetical protein